MSIPDPGPLGGRAIAVRGDDAASTHARRLLAGLGAGIGSDPAAAEATIDLEPAAVVEDWARSGAMALTGYPGEPPSPMHPGGGSIMRGALAAVAALARLRTSSSPTLPGIELLGERAAISGFVRRPGCAAGGATRTVSTADGWCVISLPRPTDIDLVAALVQSEVDDDAWSTIRQWAEELPATATVERAQLLGLAAAVVPPPETTCPPDPQASHRASRPIVTSRGGARAGTDRPLVVDLSALWAGPLCASLLAATGAEIVKVEDVNRLDGARDGPARFYDLLHAGHRSLTVDLATPAGRRQLVDLVDAADVVIESSRPRALQQLGIDAFDAVARGTVWTSITAYGRSGPWSNRVGFGDDVAAAAGLVATIDGVPVPCGDAIADPLAGAHAAAAAAAALLSDTGYLLDVSMRDVAALAASLTAEPCDVVGRSETGWTVEWAGGRCPVATPTARPAARSAAAPGADNDTILTGRAAS